MTTFKNFSPVSLDDDKQEMITIANSDSSWTLTRKQISMSELLHQALEGDPNCTRFDFNKPTWVLDKIVKFMEYHSDNPMRQLEKPLPNFVFQANVGSWDFNLIDDLGNSDLVTLIVETDYFMIKDLLSLCLCKMACLVKNSSTFDLV